MASFLFLLNTYHFQTNFLLSLYFHRYYKTIINDKVLLLLLLSNFNVPSLNKKYIQVHTNKCKPLLRIIA